MSTQRHITRSAGTLGAFTGVSRVLGFVRDMVIAAAFGTGAAAEAFVVSFKIPNLLRDLVGEGAANAAFVPVLTECREKQPGQFWPLAASLVRVLSAVLLTLTVLGILFAPQIVSLLAPGFLHSPGDEKFPLAVDLTRMMFPYIFLVGLSALAMGILNTLGEFKSSALGPALLNLSMITAGVLFEKTYGPAALVAGVLAGGLLQLGCQVLPLWRRGFRFSPAAADGPYRQKIGRLLLPRAFGSALYQVNVFVDTILASFERIVGAGGQSALYYSNRLFQLPLAVFGIALAQAALPAFSTQMVRGDLDGFRATFSATARSLMFVAIPSAAGLAVLARPIVRVLFERGRFTDYSTGITSSALFYYAFGLLSCCFIKLLVNAFYAMQDTRTPVKTMLVSVMFNIALSLLLMGPLRLGGLALASTLSATLNFALLYRALRRRLGALGEGSLLAAGAKMLLCAAAMALAAWGADRLLLGPLEGAAWALQFASLLGTIAVCAGVYFAAAFLLRVDEAHRLFLWSRTFSNSA